MVVPPAPIVSHEPLYFVRSLESSQVVLGLDRVSAGVNLGLDLGANLDRAGSNLDASNSSQMGSIVTLCVVMYGFVGLLWVLYSSLPKTSPNSVHFRVGVLCITWCSMSVGMNVLNKCLVSVLRAPAIISIVQMLITAVTVVPTGYATLGQIPRQQLATWMIVPVIFSGILLSSFYTFEYISLSLLTIVRNLAPLIAMPVERFMMPEGQRPRVPVLTFVGIGVMLCGALVYCGGVEGVSMLGMFFAALNTTLAVSDRCIQRRLLTRECKDIPSGVCALMNNGMGMIPALVLACFTGQLQMVRSPQHQADWTNPQVLLLLFVSGVVGLGICYFGFECQRAISATSFFVMQNVAKMVVVACGMLLFGDPVTTAALAGIAISACGSFIYGRTQVMIQQEEKAKATEKTPLKNDIEDADPKLADANIKNN